MLNLFTYYNSYKRFSFTVMSMYGILAQYIAKAEGKQVDSEYDQILIDTLSD